MANETRKGNEVSVTSKWIRRTLDSVAGMRSTLERLLIAGPRAICAMVAMGLFLGARTSLGAEAYRGAIVMNAMDGAVLWENGADVVNAPASMTKLMTYAVLHDHLTRGTLSPQTPVTIDRSDYSMGGTQVWLEPGEVFPVEELIYAMMIQSANDAAHALARASAGSVEAFVEEMNAKARALGMTHTHFKTPHGLPPRNRQKEDGDLSTARDFALLARHLVSHTEVLKYTIRRRDFGLPQRDKAVDMVNHNHLLGKVNGVDGLKTGYTGLAGHCLTATAQRGGKRVIVVLMGGASSKERDQKVIELLESGFGRIPADSPSFQGNTVPVLHTEEDPPQAASKPESAPPTPSPSSRGESFFRLNIPPASSKK